MLPDMAKLKTIDESDMLHLLLSFPEQFNKSRVIGEQTDIKPNDKHQFKNILFVGMGGSAIAGDLVIAGIGDEVNMPMSVIRDYSVPNYVDKSTLIFILSYSGNTEESLSAYQDAVKKNAYIICITSGGTLAEWAKRDNFPLFTIPGGQPPRTAIGYLSIPMIIALSRLEIISDKSKELDETYQLLIQKAQLYHPKNNPNPAMELSEKIVNKLPIIYCSAGLMEVVAMRWKCQFSENAKTLAFYNIFPELNHNEIVGWEMLKEIFSNFQIIYLHDKDDYYRIQKRMEITKKIFEQESLSLVELNSEGESRLARLFSLIYLGDMISYYLAIHYDVDPTPIEKIQFLKEQLKKI